MNENERLDLSALQPDAQRWHLAVDATMQRVDDVLARRIADPIVTIAGWYRPLLIAASIVLALLIPVELALEAREARAEQVDRLVTLSVDLQRAETPPSSAEFLRALTTKEAQ